MKNCSKLGSVHKPRKQSIPFITECSVGKKIKEKLAHNKSNFQYTRIPYCHEEGKCFFYKRQKKETVIRNAVGKTKLSKQFQVHI